jgi:hypothetical protein
MSDQYQTDTMLEGDWNGEKKAEGEEEGGEDREHFSIPFNTPSQLPDG